MSEAKNTFDPPELVMRFQEYIRNTDYGFSDDRVSSVMDFLYVAYAENQGKDPKEISEGFEALGEYFEQLSLDDNNTIFGLVCNLCNLYEQRAFKDGLQLGAHLILEIQRK